MVIPMVVIHELDGLKRSEDESVANRSKSALRIIHESLQLNASLVKKWMRGQSPHEVHKSFIFIQGIFDEFSMSFLVSGGRFSYFYVGIIEIFDFIDIFFVIINKEDLIIKFQR